MTDDERQSQLSAMFDGELPPAECELLARRLARDEGLRRQWGSYALIGAVVRGEPLAARGTAGARVDLAARVGRALTQPAPQTGVAEGGDESLGAGPSRQRAPRLPRWAVPLSGAGLAAGVAAAAIFWLRAEAPTAAAVANVVPSMRPAPAAEVVIPSALPAAAETVLPGAPKSGAATGAPESYTVPPPTDGTGPLVGGATLANFLVAHSEVSMPMVRRNALSTLVAETVEPVDAVAVSEPSAPASASAPSAAVSDGAER